MDDLPESLLTEVLLRLPLVALYRFKVVCTKWLSLISTPYFLSEYASRGSISPRWAFVSSEDYVFSERYPAQVHELLIDLHCGDLKCPIPYPSDEDLRRSSYRILGVSNGLVLYEYWWTDYRGDDEHDPNWCVCDPVTKRCVVLPPGISKHFWLDGCGFLTQMKDGVVASYTVVKYAMIPRRFEVLLSGTEEWKAYTPLNEYIGEVSLFPAPTDLDGILHWIDSFQGIFAYDPLRTPGAIRNIALPADGDGRIYRECRIGMCGTHDGHLRYLESYLGSRSRLSVWVLNDYGCGDSWLLLHSASYTDILKDVYPETLRKQIKLRPVSFHPLDPDIVYLGCKCVFVSYNIRDGKCQFLKTFRAIGNRNRDYKWDRAFCLVIPPIPPSLPTASPLRASWE
ncbi:putative F-box protein At3g28280 [Henckelia pumila]|uniref:putative F-box protein At3g28280 n=1 Tax=Henckelia pumila TaxID=405737 RepID=UPI003C6DFA61